MAIKAGASIVSNTDHHEHDIQRRPPLSRYPDQPIIYWGDFVEERKEWEEERERDEDEDEDEEEEEAEGKETEDEDAETASSVEEEEGNVNYWWDEEFDYDHVTATVWRWALTQEDENDFEERDRLHNAAVRFHDHYVDLHGHPDVNDMASWLLEATTDSVEFEERLNSFSEVLEDMKTHKHEMKSLDDFDYYWDDDYGYDHVTTTIWWWALTQKDRGDFEERDRFHNAALRFHDHYVDLHGHPDVNDMVPWLLDATADPEEFEERLDSFSTVLEEIKTHQNEVKLQENFDYYWDEDYGYDHVTTTIWRWALTQEYLDDYEERDRLHNAALRFHVHYEDFVGFPAVNVMVPWLLDATANPPEFEQRLGTFSTVLEVMKTHQDKLHPQRPLVAVPDIVFDGEVPEEVDNAERVPIPLWHDGLWGFNIFLHLLINLPTCTVPHTPLILKVILPAPSSSPADSAPGHGSVESCLLPKDRASCPPGFFYTVKVIRIGRRD